MTVLRGRRLVGAGALETYTITRPAPTEHSGLTTVLPTTEPGTSQISVTVASGDFYLPAGLQAPYVGVILAQVLNSDATSRTVSWRMVKGGSSVANGTVSVAASQRGRIEAYFSPPAPSGNAQGVGVVAGDVIELRLWAASSTNVQLVYWTYFVLDTRTRPTVAEAVRDCTFTTTGNYPVLASWPGGGAASGATLFHPVGDSTSTAAISTGLALRGAFVGGYGLWRVNQGDSANQNGVVTNTGASPNYGAQNEVSAFSVRRVPVS